MADTFNVFLVDDNEIDIVVNSKLLRLANVTDSITAFNSGGQMMSYFSEHAKALSSQVNVILLDIQMPEKDGFECLDDLATLPKKFIKSTKVFMLSASIDRNDILRAEQKGGVVRVMEKPLDVYLLQRLLKS
jgi:CheY-like chemotaxis protein